MRLLRGRATANVASPPAIIIIIIIAHDSEASRGLPRAPRTITAQGHVSGPPAAFSMQVMVLRLSLLLFLCVVLLPALAVALLLVLPPAGPRVGADASGAAATAACVTRLSGGAAASGLLLHVAAAAVSAKGAAGAPANRALTPALPVAAAAASAVAGKSAGAAGAVLLGVGDGDHDVGPVLCTTTCIQHALTALALAQATHWVTAALLLLAAAHVVKAVAAAVAAGVDAGVAAAVAAAAFPARLPLVAGVERPDGGRGMASPA